MEEAKEKQQKKKRKWKAPGNMNVGKGGISAGNQLEENNETESFSGQCVSIKNTF